MKDQVEKKEQLLNNLRKKYDDELSSKLNSQSALSQKSSKQNSQKSYTDKRRLLETVQHEFEQRMKYFEEQKKKKQEEKLSMEQQKYTFNPQINDKSRRMVSKEQYATTTTD